MPTPLRNAILALSPYLYWPLDETSGTTAFDLSGNGLNGTYAGTVNLDFIPVPGDAPSTAYGPINSSVTTPTNSVSRAGLADSGTLTLIFHFFNGEASFTVSGSEVPLSWSGGSTDGYYFQFNAGNFFSASIGTATGYKVVQDNEAMIDFAPHWNQAVATWDVGTTTWSFYVNGRLIGQQTAVALHGTPPTQNFNVGFFRATAGNQQGYTGGVAHVAIIHSVITAAQVLALYNASGVAPLYAGNVGSTVQGAASPIAYTLGTVSSGLTGSGTIAVPQLYGVWVEITAHPGSWGHTQDSPARYLPTFGQIQFSDLNADTDGYQVHYLQELIFSPNRTNLFLRYSFRPGVTASIHPITL